MVTGATAGAGAAAAAAAIANAIKASGVLVQVEPGEFTRILSLTQEPLVVYAPPRGLFASMHRYLTSYKGLAFHTKCPDAMDLGGSAQVVMAKKIWIPG